MSNVQTAPQTSSAHAAGAAPVAESRTRALTAAQSDFLYPWVRPYYGDPLALAEGEGVWVRDVDGDEYLDLFAGILTTSVGHCNPTVVAAARAQMERLGHTSALYVTEGQIEAARSLAEITPGALRTTCFTNSGTEAVESAVATARLYTGRHEIVALRLSYSGRSTLTSHMTAQGAWRLPGGGVDGIVHARSPYLYRSPVGAGPEATDFFIDDLVEVIETTTGGKPAAFFAETIQGVAGVIVPPPKYFRRAAEVIRSYGGLFIIDEVQAGFGRTGDRWFGIEHWGVEPDIMVMAKGIANGFPVGATVTRPEIAEAWQGPSISTYGGNSISMAAMGATLGVMKSENAPARAAERGAQLRAGLETLKSAHDWIGEVRGMGLMQGIEMVEDRAGRAPDGERAGALLEAAREERLLIGRGGLNGHVIRIGPSLLIAEDEMAEGIRRLAAACRRIDG
ncbi:aspartate aminotransferase family protein [Candidatus Palauibacter polyketidifaciens]|uniref:aspartate aminotransferase family protein n=1 Tax=Candidatus Palauibacter polyketidifaciens TaxID=3056740 RepID=UPI00238F521F|nr:aspartate aminotransferase family protein [Candidatus Palauibacter polyketidifaciens]MDE2719069.1 aspartate aminotransferase family protein [Candidatus Palauibacter polyketidifaciens]